MTFSCATLVQLLGKKVDYNYAKIGKLNAKKPPEKSNRARTNSKKKTVVWIQDR